MNIKLMKNFAPKIFIDIKALNKMKEYIRQSSLEIGWLGTCEKIENNYFITDVFLFKQEVHATTTEITTEGLSEFAMELLNTPGGLDIWNNMKVWGHSHVNMGTSPSTQDDKQVDVFAENADDFFIRIIANKKNDFRIDLYDFTSGVLYEQLPYEVDFGEDEEYITALYNKIAEIEGLIKLKTNPDSELISSIKEEIKDKVTEKKITFTKSYNSTNDYYYGWYGDYNYSSKKKETSKKEKEESKVNKIFNELSRDEIFELMYYLEYGLGSEDYINCNDLSHNEVMELQMMIEDYVFTSQEEYDKYVGYSF